MKKYLDLIKDNFNLLVAVPPLLGAIWQLIELSKISFSYIRFFSITQLISDGILILIFSLYVLTSYFWINWVLNIPTLKELKLNFTAHSISSKNNFIYFMLLIFVGFLLLFGLHKVNLYLSEVNLTYTFLWMILPINIIIILIAYSIIKQSLKYHNNSSNIRFTVIILILFMSVIFITSLKIYFLKFNDSLLLPDNSINIEKIEKNIKSDYPNSTIKLKYFNDKYLFYSIIDSTNTEKIKIEDFEILFK